MCIVNKSVENNLKAQKLISYNLLSVYFFKICVDMYSLLPNETRGCKKIYAAPKVS